MEDFERIKNEVHAMEERLLQPEVRASWDELNKLLAEDFLEFGSSGETFNKEHVLSQLPNTTQRLEIILTNFEARPLASDVLLTNFMTYHTSQGKYVLRSSIWKRNEDKWQMTFHQGTPTQP